MFTILTGVVRHAKILQCTNLEIFPGKLASYSEYSERHSFPNYQSFLHICYKQPIYFSKYTASVKALLWLSLWLQMNIDLQPTCPFCLSRLKLGQKWFCYLGILALKSLFLLLTLIRMGFFFDL